MDIQTERIRDIRTHLLHIGQQLRPLRNHGGVNILYHEALLLQKRCDLLQQDYAGNPPVLLICIREMFPDISERRRAETAKKGR